MTIDDGLLQQANNEIFNDITLHNVITNDNDNNNANDNANDNDNNNANDIPIININAHADIPPFRWGTRNLHQNFIQWLANINDADINQPQDDNEYADINWNENVDGDDGDEDILDQQNEAWMD